VIEKPLIKPIQLNSKDISRIRAEILRIQNGTCPICLKTITDPCLDHSHKKRIKGSGLVRGVLGRNCNSFVGKIENHAKRFGFTNQELPEILRSIASFLEKEPYPFIHPTEKPKEKKIGKRFFEKIQKEFIKKYPKKKPLVFPKSGKLNKQLQNLCKEFNLTPVFLQKGKKNVPISD